MALSASLRMCRGDKHVTAIKGARSRPSAAYPDGKERKSLYQCNACPKQFTVRKGTIENYFSVFKRGVKVTCQHCGMQHLLPLHG